MCIFLLFSGSAFADDAASCVQLGKTAKGQSMKNTCAEQIVIFWCHDQDQKGYRSGVCGKGDRYYTLNSTFKPGETNDNQYSLPANAHISYGACVGDYKSYKYTDKKGGYLCKPPKGAASETSAMINTASAPTEEQACKRAMQLAGEHGALGKCTCQVRGKIHICRVPSSSPKPEGSAIGTLKGKIREELQCKPNKIDCQPAQMRNGGSGLRD
jgi:hypothetical protein